MSYWAIKHVRSTESVCAVHLWHAATPHTWLPYAIACALLTNDLACRLHTSLAQALAAQRLNSPIPLPQMAAELRPTALATGAWLKVRACDRADKLLTLFI